MKLISDEEIDQIAESSGCDMSGMDGREYETMWCCRAEFSQMTRAIEKLATERALRLAAEVCEEGTELCAFQSKDCYRFASNRRDAILKLMEE